MHEHVTTFGDLLRRLRSAAALSQEALAERAGLSRSGISDLERGARQVPRLETVRTLADALALSDADRTALLATARPALLGVDASEPPPSTLIELPVPLTRLIGRETEVMTLRAALEDAGTRLLTLSGPGGVGKTRLAIAIAAGLPDAFPDGVVFVDLAPLTDSALVILTVADAFGVREITGQPLIETLSALLAPKQVLLVLDNCEHVLAETADLVGRLLSRCPQLHILATSRAPLHMRGEQVQPVEPLPLAADGVTSFEQLAKNASVSLFVERAQAVRPAFQLDHANAPTVAAICRHLDGLPLAIELAAARTTMFTPEALLVQMGDRLRLLRGGARDAPARQQTMRATIAWSHDVLSVEQQALFRRLAGFAGGFTADAAEAVAGACGDREEEAEDVLMTLGTLIDASLVQTQAVPNEPRFAMFETIREYAREQLLASGEEDAVRESHASWFLSLAEASAPQPTAFARMDQLMAEHENLRAALHWFAARRHAESLLRLTSALTWFWYFGGYIVEGIDWQERALATRTGVSPRALLATLYGAAMLANQQNDHERATALGEELLALACAARDRGSEADARFVLSRAASQRGAGEEALAFAAEAVALYREVENDGRLPWAVQRLGVETFITGDVAQAAGLFAEALEWFRAMSSTIGTAYALNNLGLARHAMGDRLGAAALCRERLLLLRDMRDPWETANLLELIAALASETGAAEAAARLLGAAAGLYETSGAQAQPYVRRIGDRTEAEARVHLGPEGYAAAWAAGHALSFARVIADAEETVDAVEAALSSSESAPAAAACSY